MYELSHIIINTIMFNVNRNLWGYEKAAKLLNLIPSVWETEKGKERAWERDMG